MKVLLVNIQERQNSLIHLFHKNGIVAEYADDYKALFYNIENAEYDAIVLNIKDDSFLDSSYSFLGKMTNENRPEGLLVIAGRTELPYRLNFFEKGADDVVLPDCDPMELIARLKAIIKRKKFNIRNKLYFANLVIHFEERRVHVWNNPISLTRKEYEILLHLIANKNRVLSKESLAGYLWSDYSDKSDSFDFLFTHLKNLRRKLLNAKAEIIIKNIYGSGYQIEEY